MSSRHRRTRRPSSKSKCASTSEDLVTSQEGGGYPERLRFHEFAFERLANGRCRARVVLTWADGRQFVGESEGVISQAGELRCSAHAAVRALERVVQPKLTFEVLG